VRALSEAGVASEKAPSCSSNPSLSEPDAAATPLEALSGSSTPIDAHFRRSHFPYPAEGSAALRVGGAVRRPLRLMPVELLRYAAKRVSVVLECAGHRRAELDPTVPGLAWGVGALSQATWLGVPLSLLLAQAGASPDAIEVVLTGADGDGELGFARSIPMAKACEETTLVAFGLEAGEIPRTLGGPIRAIVPGHYAVDSVKWLVRVDVVTEPFLGRFQQDDYRYYGASGLPDGAPLGELPVSSLITRPADDSQVRAGTVEVTGVAWGSAPVAYVDVRVDVGPWLRTRLRPANGSHAFTPWHAEVVLEPGPHVVSARATDGQGGRQPARPLWNELGYGNNSVHAVTVTAS
jgi:DMSO/TMAO reductase YedYZ molybdopterin-dependent catalytic subunit